MLNFNFMHKVAMCFQRPNYREEKTILPMNYNAWYTANYDSEMGENDICFAESEKGNLISERDHFEKTPVNLQWKNITLKTKGGKRLLSELSGSTCSGELTAIMGPSGAGKTSLMNVLSGFVQERVTGEVFVNGTPRNMATFRKLTCYVLQEDHIMTLLTVRELITIASRLKLPTTKSESQRQKIVNDCIQSFGLDAQQNQKAGTLSGGQRKRLCIAQEIVNNPPLIFLDEPTSGLDSSSCLQCMQLLKSLAEEGRNVICTIHQPSSRIFEIFNNIYMIADGQCIYRGSTNALLPFLKRQGLICPQYHSPTDFMTDVAIGFYGDWNWKLKNALDSEDQVQNRWYETHKMDNEKTNSLTITLWSCFNSIIKNRKEKKWSDESCEDYATSFFHQYKVLLKRSYLNIIRESWALKLKFASSIIIGLLFGSLYYNTGNDGVYIFHSAGFLLTLLIFLIVSTEVPTILTFPAQRSIFEREYMNGWYTIKSYYMARTMADLPFQIIFPTITCSIVYWMSGQPAEMSRFGLFLLSTIMICLIADSIGLLIGAGLSVENGIYIGGVLTTPAIVLSGAIISLKDTPTYLRWLCYLTYTRYGLQSIYLNLFTNRTLMECSQKVCYFRDPMQLVKYKNMEGDITVDYWAMLAFFVFYRIASYIVLYLKVSGRR